MNDKERKDLIKKGRGIMDRQMELIEEYREIIKQLSIEILNLQAEIKELKHKQPIVEIKVSGVKIECPDDFYELIEDLADTFDCFFGGIKIFNEKLVNQLKKAGLIRKTAKAGEKTCGTGKLRKLEKKILDDYLDAKDKVEKCHS